MSPHDAFLQAILDRPDDDGPRLIYADWLEERGDPRGEFIRVQCALARGADEAQRARLEAREQRLLAEYRVEWSRPLWNLGCTLPGVALKGGFRRGFIEEAEVDAPVFLEGAEALFRAAPLRHLLLRRAAGRLTELATSSWLERLAGLSVGENETGPAGVRALAASPFLAGLVHLDLSDNGIGDEGAAALASSRGLTGLVQLVLWEAVIGPAGARALADAPNFPRLAELDLRENRLGPAGAAALVESPRLVGLTVLALDENGVGDGGAAALAASPHLAGLTTLHLDGNGIGDLGARAMAGSPHLGRLSVLSLFENPIGEDAAEALRQRFGDRVRLG